MLHSIEIRSVFVFRDHAQLIPFIHRVLISTNLEIILLYGHRRYPNFLSDNSKAFVDEQVTEGDFANASGYVAALIHAEAKAKAQDKLEALPLEGLESAEATPWTDADWEALKNRIEQA